MPNLSLSSIPSSHLPAARWTAATLASLAREEHLERRPRRLTEPNHATWRQFRGRMGWSDLVDLLAEDAAVLHPVPFDCERLLGPKARYRRQLPMAQLQQWIDAVGDATEPSGADYVRDQAKRFDLTTLFARANLHQVKPHHRILELPGTGGQLAHHVVTTQDGIYIQDSFTVACTDWRELALAGFITVELRAPHADFASIDPDLSQARTRSFDYVFGLAPEKGGRFPKERLLELFGNATVVLV